MDSPGAKFGDFGLSRFGFIVRTDRITDADDRYTHATTVGVSNYQFERGGRSCVDVGCRIYRS